MIVMAKNNKCRNLINKFFCNRSNPILFFILSLVSLFFLSAAVIPAFGACPADMISYWKLNEEGGGSYLDYNANNNAVCFGSCPAYTIDGRINGGQMFNGSTTGLNVPADTSFDWGPNDSFSIEYWMKRSQGSITNNEVILGRNDSSSNLHWWSGLSIDGKPHFVLIDTNGDGGESNQFLLGSTVLADGLWHHIAAIRNANTHQNILYVDGKIEAVTSVTYTSGFNSATAMLNMGWLNTGSGYHYSGTLDEVAVYNKVLSDIEISQHYHDGYVGLRLGYCEGGEDGYVVKIMPLGDSITLGSYPYIPVAERAGYRQKLFLDLQNFDFNMDFVGSLQAGDNITPAFDIDHEGHGGWSASQILNGRTDYPEAGNLFDWLTHYSPDVILLHIGTNYMESTSSYDIDAILDEIDMFNEDITVILALIINQDPYNTWVTEFNESVENMANSRIANGDKIVIVDQENALTYPDDLSDPLHPDMDGYHKMADVWLGALVNILPLSNNFAGLISGPIIFSRPITEVVNNVPYTYDVNAFGNPAPTYSLTIAPSGMTINPSTGVIEWTPSTLGKFNVTVKASNTKGDYLQKFTVEVNNDGIIIDNACVGTSSTGTWSISSAVSPYGGLSLYSKEAGATYSFDASITGSHEVYLWWTQYKTRCTSVQVDIYDGATLLDTVVVNQQTNGGDWNLLSTYNFTESAKVVINSAGNCTTCADAVRFSPVGSRIVIDNGEAGTSHTGSWIISGGVSPYGENSLYSKEAGAAYSFDASITGSHEVYLWWTQYSTRCTNVQVDIYDGATLLDTVGVNQQTNGGDWNILGTYNFSESAKVIIHSTGACTTCADAVRFDGLDLSDPELDSIEIEGPITINENSSIDYSCRAYYTDGTNRLVEADTWDESSSYSEISATGLLTTSEVASDESCQITASYTEGGITREASFDITIKDSAATTVIMDNGDAGTSSAGSWIVSGGASPYDTNSLYSKEAGATYSFDSATTGSYEVSIWWTQYSTRCTNVQVDIYDGATLLDTFAVNQQTNGGIWNILGAYNFTESAKVVIHSAGSCTTCADAVRFSPASSRIIIDNGTVGTSYIGSWIISGGASPYGVNSLYSKQAGATYSFDTSITGSHEVYLWWTQYSTRCTNVQVDIYDGATLLDTVGVNQQTNGGDWNLLSTYSFTESAKVVINSTGSCTTCADAVLFDASDL